MTRPLRIAARFRGGAGRFALALVVGACWWPATSPASECCAPPRWIFQPSTYTHDRVTGARVAQYSRVPPVEPLPDQRLITSGYRRTRTSFRGPNGSLDTYYQVQNYANGRGGLDAEWERFHDAWLQSFSAGGYYNSGAIGYPYPQYGYGFPPYGFPGRGYPIYGSPGYPHPGGPPPSAPSPPAAP